MRSIRLLEVAGEVTLVETDIPRPEPRKGEVLIRVHAAGVTPTELRWYPTSHTRNGEKRIGAVPSHEFSGEIAAFGDGVQGLSAGQQVYGMNDWFDDGATAEYCITRPEWITAKPKTIDHTQAASVPIGALTASQGLFERAKLQAGERILIHGGAGAVGVFAIQLARLNRAHVITTVSARNVEFVKALGAHKAIDYNAGPFENQVRDIDVIFDCVGGETLRRSWSVLKRSGRLTTIAADAEGASDERTKNAFFIVAPRQKQLIETGRLIDAGDLRPVVDASVPFSEAPAAYSGDIHRSGRGKMVITLV